MENQDFQTMLPIGSELQGGRYRVERQLASGGFGNTYVVRNTTFGDLAAMKEFFMKGVNERDAGTTQVSVSNTTNGALFEGQREKFKKEARRLRALTSPYLVKVHDLFEENGTAYYVMDYVDGESLAERMKCTRQPMSEDEVRRILLQVLDALGEVHRQQIWHLDLKPGNIMIDRQNNVKIIDFGASKQLSATGSYATTTTSMCYTPGFAPAEQIDQDIDRIGPWTDLYALGATAYNLLTRQAPPTLSELQEPDAFRFPATVSQDMQQLVAWMMNPSRSRRPQSVEQVLQRFNDSNGHQVVPPQQSAQPKAAAAFDANPTVVRPKADDSTRVARQEDGDNEGTNNKKFWRNTLFVVLGLAIPIIFFMLLQNSRSRNNEDSRITATEEQKDSIRWALQEERAAGLVAPIEPEPWDSAAWMEYEANMAMFNEVLQEVTDTTTEDFRREYEERLATFEEMLNAGY